MNFHQSYSMTVLTIVVASLAGCQGKGKQARFMRPPIDPSRVVLYQSEPFEYEVVGTVEVQAEMKWEQETELTPIVESLKSRAAELGANGLLLMPQGDPRTSVQITGRYNNQFYQIPYRLKPTQAAYAKAIWVPPERNTNRR